MKKSVFPVLTGMLLLPLFLAAQATPPAPGPNALADYTRQIKYDGLTLSVLLVNSRTVEVLFQAPTKYSM